MAAGLATEDWERRRTALAHVRNREPRLEWLVALLACLSVGSLLYAADVAWELVAWGVLLGGPTAWVAAHRMVRRRETTLLVTEVRRAAAELGVKLRVEEAARLLSTSAVVIGMYRYVIASDDGRWVALRLEHFAEPPDVSGDGGSP